MPVQTDRLAVYLEKPSCKGFDEFTAGNFQNSLKNHIDYLLWEKGWDFEFIRSPEKPTLHKLLNLARTRGFDYLLYLNSRAIFGTAKSEAKDTSGSEAGYPVLRINLQAYFAKLTDSAGGTDSARVEDSTVNKWLETGDSILISSKLIRPEPPEYTLMRALGRLLDFMPANERAALSYSDSIPFYLSVDSRILNDRPGGTDSLISRAAEYASYSLSRQLGIGLHLCEKTYFTSSNAQFSDIGRLFESFVKTESGKSDTIIVCVFRPENAQEYYLGDNKIRTGVSDIGRKTSVVAELRPPNAGLTEWSIFLNGQLILHELGHLLGAIHVFDIGSVMTERRDWVASNRFDELNSDIIKRGREDKSRLGSLKNYALFLAEEVGKAKYKLSNYPAVFASLINADKSELENLSFGTTKFMETLHSAADGYKYYLLNKKDSAAESFSRALEGDSTQAAIYYYLSQVTAGKLSESYLNKALKIGLYIPYEETSSTGERKK